MPDEEALHDGARPRLPRHVKFRFDRSRDAWVLLAPERVLMPDEIAVEILKRCTGDTTLAAVIDDLAAGYEADRNEIAGDVTEMLRGLIAQGLVVA